MVFNILAAILIVLSPVACALGRSLANLSLRGWQEEKKVADYQELKQEWENWNQHQQSSISSLLANNPNFLPIRNWNIQEPEVDAASALVFETYRNKILYQKDINQVLPIASLTKIITALVSLDYLTPEEIVVVSEQALAGYGEQGGLAANEKISVRNLLHALLMESSNDAALVLAGACEQKTGKNFVDLMNWKAKEVIGLAQTSFTDPSGYNSGNVSTAQEVSQMLMFSFRQPLVWQILRTSAIDLTSADGKIKHHWINTDKMLDYLPNIAGGKTGYTLEAQGCLALAVECFSEDKKGYLITVILGSPERFVQTEKLVNWAKKAYMWQ